MPIFLADSNYLNDDKLLEYLKLGPTYRVAICHHVMVEAHKNEPRLTIKKTFERARQFPNQVVRLTSVVDLYSNRLDTGGKILKAFITDDTADDFVMWYDTVIAEPPSIQTLMTVTGYQQLALNLVERFASDAHMFEAAFAELKSRFTNAEIREIQARVLSSASTVRKLRDIVFDSTEMLFKAGEIPNRPKTEMDSIHYFLMRYAACVVIFFIRYVKAGNLTSNTDKMVNHIMDLHIAAQATFFHGVLSFDKVLNDVHYQSRRLLNLMGAHRFTLPKGSYIGPRVAE